MQDAEGAFEFPQQLVFYAIQGVAFAEKADWLGVVYLHQEYHQSSQMTDETRAATRYTYLMIILERGYEREKDTTVGYTTRWIVHMGGVGY